MTEGREGVKQRWGGLVDTDNSVVMMGEGVGGGRRGHREFKW